MKSVGIILLVLSMVSCQGTDDRFPDQAADLHRLLSADSPVYPIVSAHRGGPAKGLPENALETFRVSSSAGLMLIECDVAMTSDSVLVLYHDDTLGRTSTGKGLISTWTWDSLQSVNLIDPLGFETGLRIPRFDSVLVWAKDRTLLAVDIKRTVPIDQVLRVLGNYRAADRATIITYRGEDAVYIHQQNPDLHLSVTIRNLDEWYQFRQTGIPVGQVMAFTGLEEPPAELLDTLHRNGIASIIGTFRSADLLQDSTRRKSWVSLLSSGYRILATDHPLLADELIDSLKSE
ncbi:MAG: glycerophosphodiester phosphodiesterase family protein [Bacteroidetes bacterium]|nr:glycerophosphodiester phosphodiesterase family protein [Bacteroidota bacterium]